jgi:hypothetical protein
MHNASMRRLSDLMRDLEDGSLVLKPAFQRRLVWTNVVKDHFLDTVLRGLPFPEIFFATGEVHTKTMQRKNLLVDGQQRLSTLREYVQGSSDLVLKEAPRYEDLDEAAKTKFLDYSIAVRDLGSMTEAEVKEVFARINSTDYSLNAMERMNARFNGAFKSFCDELSRHEFFDKHNVFSMTDYRRMRDLDFCVILSATLLSTYYHRDTLNVQYLRDYNDSFTQAAKLGKQLAAVFEFIDECNFDKRSRVWKKTDLFTLIVELSALLSKKVPLEPSQVSAQLQDFFDAVNNMYKMKGTDEELAKKAPNPNVFRYLKAATKATNDKYARVERAEVISSVLLGTTDQKSPRTKGKRAKK